MLESKVEKDLREAAAAAGGLCLKFVSPGRRGVTDRILLFPNRVIAFVETKSPTGRLRPDQKKFIDLMREFGFSAGVVRDPAAARRVVNVLKKRSRS